VLSLAPYTATINLPVCCTLKDPKSIGCPHCSVDQVGETAVRAEVDCEHAPFALAHGVDQPQVLQEENARVHHQEDERSGHAKRRAETFTIIAEALQRSEVHVALREIAQNRQHEGELQRVAKPKPRRRDLETEERGPASFAESERQRDEDSEARASEHREGTDKDLDSVLVWITPLRQ